MGYAKNIMRGQNVYLISGAVLSLLGVVLCYFGYVK
jgi:hypothetical protein